ncbi:MAG: hypothetical protein ACJLS2_11085 [Microcella pacifica]
MVSDETPKKTPKKRAGLFGGRAPKKAAEHAGSASRPERAADARAGGRRRGAGY